MSRILYILSIIVFLHTSNIAYSQKNMSTFSQQLYSNTNFNPAAVPNENTVEAYLYGRHQWVGFNGAPASQMLSLQGYIPEIKSGISTNILTEVFGKHFTLNAKIGYSYHVQLGESASLSFGLSAGILFKNFKGSAIVLEDGSDPYISLEDETDIKPDLDFGLAFTVKKFTIGVSVTHLTAFAYNGKNDYFAPTPAYYVFMQYRGKITDKFRLEPYLKAYYTEEYFGFDIHLHAHFLDIFWVGAGYRYSDALIFTAGAKLGKVFMLSYSYDFNLGGIKAYSSGSHEIVLGLRFQTAKQMGESLETPRDFE